MFSFGTMKRESKWCAFARNHNFHHAAEQFNFSFNYNQVMDNSHSYELTNLLLMNLRNWPENRSTLRRIRKSLLTNGKICRGYLIRFSPASA